jgi:hypothetical protein
MQRVQAQELNCDPAELVLRKPLVIDRWFA